MHREMDRNGVAESAMEGWCRFLVLSGAMSANWWEFEQGGMVFPGGL